MNRAVFDTNVVVSGFLSPAGPPGRIVEWLRNGSVLAVLDDRIMAEYDEVLKRPQFGLPVSEVNLVLVAIRAQAFWIEATANHTMRGLPDPDDAAFLECVWNVLWRRACRWSRATSAIFRSRWPKILL
jgi:putative PIN family toxin of toxin-antitoxin system